ncbi:hypothetical protein P9D43_19440 [Neobacillus niacini]|uniref:hypothetical protein n=1 Tax=Neobacillus niacini TaxID=86668 RepID=UPI000AC36AC2|nr:hypothetical protein [Neobacillus niacini]MEC1524180.1 hypothetical protein [Neobacillus niacini]
MTNDNQTYLFSTDVTDDENHEFVVEFYQCLMDDLPEKFPYKVTKTFDELIDFFEEMD